MGFEQPMGQSMPEKPSTGLNLTPAEQAFMDKEHDAKQKAEQMKHDNGKSWEEVEKELEDDKGEEQGMDKAA